MKSWQEQRQRTSRTVLWVLAAYICVGAAPATVQADVPAPEHNQAAENGQAVLHPRALSRAFRAAARKATPSVVTILSYGQESVLRT